MAYSANDIEMKAWGNPVDNEYRDKIHVKSVQITKGESDKPSIRYVRVYFSVYERTATLRKWSVFCANAITN